MKRPFRLFGNTEAKFDQLEKIIPRVLRRMGTKTFGIIPSSMLSAYVKEVTNDGVILRCALFKGKIKKVLFKIITLEGKEAPEYVVRIGNEQETRKLTFATKKLSHIMEVNIDVEDGDLAEISLNQTFDKDGKVNTVIKDIYITILLDLAKDLNEVKEVLTDELDKTIEDELKDEPVVVSDEGV